LTPAGGHALQQKGTEICKAFYSSASRQPAESGPPICERGLYDQLAIKVNESQVFLLFDNLLDFAQL